MKVALMQVSSPDDESQHDRIERVSEMMSNLDDVDLVVLPELWSAGYFNFEHYDNRSEDINGPTVRTCAAAARELGAYVHVGSIVEASRSEGFKNTSVLLDPQGRIIHSYSKIHVFGYQSRESQLLATGDSLPVAHTPFGQVAGTTCYDLRFPGLWMEMSDRGADLVVVPAAWPSSRREHWRLLTSARALEHQIFVLACNAVGEQGGNELAGYSRVVDPSGRTLAEAGDGEEILHVEIEPKQVEQVREEFPVLADRLTTYAHLRR